MVKKKSPPRLPTQVIAIGNQKGGVGKTTTTVNLAAALGELGKKCLIIDLDANCGATRALGIPPTSFQGIVEVMLGEEDPLAIALETDPDEGIELPHNVSLIPASRDLEMIDAMLVTKREYRHGDVKTCLTKPIEAIVKSGRFDYVFLDTAPNVMVPTSAAYRVARWFILTATPERLAVEGLNDALDDISVVREAYNRRLELLGVVLSCVNRRTRLATQLVQWVTERFEVMEPYGTFATRISRSTAVAYAQNEGQTILQREPAHKVTEQYRALAREVIERVNLKTTKKKRAPAKSKPEPKEAAHG